MWEGWAAVGAAGACERTHWGLRWSSRWGHETCEGCAEMGVGEACERSHWGLRWSSLWGHDPREGCATVGAVLHATPTIGAFGGAPYGATKRVRGVPKWGGAAMRTLPLGPSAELLWGHDPREECAEMARGRHANSATGAFGGAPYGATILVRGVPKWGGAPMRTLPLGPSVELPMGPRTV